MTIVLIFAMVLGFVAVTRPFTVLFHELGHALPAMLFTRRKVELYLGSYGKRENAFNVRIGLLEIWAQHNIFWMRGLCMHESGEITKTQEFLILIGGVFMSLLLAAIGFISVLKFDAHGFFKLFMFFMLVFAAVDIVTNLVPATRNGLSNDGMLLKLLLSSKSTEALFPQETKELIAKSREVAIALGCDYVSTMHLLLADCAMPYNYSLRHLFFEDEAQFVAFYESQREGPSGSASGSLPITTELEESFKLAGMSGIYEGGGDIYPCHLFLAASKVDNALFKSMVKESQDMQAQLLSYYTACGQPVKKAVTQATPVAWPCYSNKQV